MNRKDMLKACLEIAVECRDHFAKRNSCKGCKLVVRRGFCGVDVIHCSDVDNEYFAIRRDVLAAIAEEEEKEKKDE